MPITGSHFTLGIGWDLAPASRLGSTAGCVVHPLITIPTETFPKRDTGFAAYLGSIKTFLEFEPVISVQSVPRFSKLWLLSRYRAHRKRRQKKKEFTCDILLQSFPLQHWGAGDTRSPSCPTPHPLITSVAAALTCCTGNCFSKPREICSGDLGSSTVLCTEGNFRANASVCNVLPELSILCCPRSQFYAAPCTLYSSLKWSCWPG